MPELHRRYDHDVLVIGAGGAGLRAAIEASAAGVSVGLVCKSLLGKAHTVMAEGGIAAALANVDDRDNWKVHFSDTMRGGQYVNNWRMAELHAKEAPDRVRELEAWGAVFDRTTDGTHPPAQLRRPSLSAPRPRRRSHRPRADPHAAGPRRSTGHRRCTWSARSSACSRTAAAWSARSATSASAAGFSLFSREGGRPRHRRHRPRVSRSRATAGNAPATATRSPIDAGAELIDMEFVQFHPTGMVWPPSVQRHPRDRGRPRRRRRAAQQQRRALHVRRHPRRTTATQTADNEEEGWRYTQGDKTARRPPELLTRDHVARCIVREIKEGRGSPHGGVFLDIAWIKAKLPNAEEHIKRKLPSMYHQFKQLADIDITKEPMEVGPTTHYIMGGVHVDAETQMSSVAGVVRRRRVRVRDQRRQPARRQFALGHRRVRQARGRVRRDLREGAHAGRAERGADRDAARADALAPFDRGGDGEGPYKVMHDLQATMQDLVGIVRKESEMREALTRLGDLNARAAKVGVAGHREYHWAGTRRSTCAIC